MHTSAYTAPNYAASPVTLQQVKDHLKIDGTDFDNEIGIARLSAIAKVAAATKCALSPQVQNIYFDRWPGEWLHGQPWPWREWDSYVLPFYPVNSIVSLIYTGSDGTATTWGSSNYLLNTAAQPCKLHRAYGISWPSITKYPVNPIAIRIQCGYTDGNPSTNGPAFPDELKSAILLMAEHLFRNSSVVEVGITPQFSAVVQRSYDYLIEPFILGHQGAIYEQ